AAHRGRRGRRARLGLRLHRDADLLPQFVEVVGPRPLPTAEHGEAGYPAADEGDAAEEEVVFFRHDRSAGRENAGGESEPERNSPGVEDASARAIDEADRAGAWSQAVVNGVGDGQELVALVCEIGRALGADAVDVDGAPVAGIDVQDEASLLVAARCWLDVNLGDLAPRDPALAAV